MFEALRYPTRGEDRVETLLVGGGLHLLVAAIPLAAPVSLLLVAGYVVRVLSRVADAGAIEAAASPPAFRDVGRLVRDGVVAVLVAAAYLLVPAVVLGVTTGGALRAGGTADGAGRVMFLVGSLASLFLALGVVYPLPAALGAYAVTGRVRAAFDREALTRAATDLQYFVAVGGGAACLVVAAVAVTTLDRIVVGFFLAFYLELAAAALMAAGAADAVAPLVGRREGREGSGRSDRRASAGGGGSDDAVDGSAE